MARDINLNGGEITILKTIGFSGQISGKTLIDRMDDVIAAEFLDSLGGMMSLGYVLSSKVNVRSMEDVERANFRINPARARELKDSVHPSRNREVKRERRERRG